MTNALIHLFPATIHPMVVHFTIAVIYLAGLSGVLALIFRKDRFYARAFLLLLGLSIIVTLAAGVAGVISESYVHIGSTVAADLNRHKEDGELTGVLVVIGFLFQVWKWWRQGQEMRASFIAVLFSLAAVVMVSFTGHLGGMMVYHYGLGVH